MRTVLGRAAGRASFILVATGMVGSAVLPAVPATAAAPHRAVVKHAGTADTQIGTAVKYVRDADGTVRQVR
jgi:hypothetical protein